MAQTKHTGSVTTFLLCGMVMIIDGYDLSAMALAVPHVAGRWGIPPSAFGLALSAVLIGLGAGAFFLGPLGDRFGRRPVVLASVAVLALATLGTATSGALTQFVLWRFATGLALGACLPNVTALVAELAPQQRRAGLLILVSCGVSLGAIGAGLIAPFLIALGGWPMLFMAIGALTILLFLLLLFRLPESPQFQAGLAAEKGQTANGRGKGVLLLAPFTRPFRLATLVFAGLYTVNAFALYMLTSWVPTILPQAGFSMAAGARFLALVQGGGLAGGLLLSWFLDRGRTVPALMTGYLLVAACLATFSILPPAVISWGMLLFVVGAGIAGAHLALMAVGTTFYPPAVLSSAIGVAVTLARLGAIGGPLIGGQLIAGGASAATFFLVLAIPVLICAAGTIAIPAAGRRTASRDG